jgi:phenylalanyl-tRNA synthetase beta chain
LDDVDRPLDEFTVLVCDTAGSLSIAGVMGGAESEVYDASEEVLDAQGIPLPEGELQPGKVSLRKQSTVNILLEGAAWNYINIRQTVAAQKLQSEAAYRFSRGVHPAMAERGVRRGIELMRQLAGGTICKGLVDNYPLPPAASNVEITPADVERWLGIQLSAEEIVKILESLDFKCQVSMLDEGITILVTSPDHRMDIAEGIIGKADLMEEIARIYGYDHIPETRMADELPPQRDNPRLEHEEKVRDLLVEMGLQEIVNYRLTTPEREARRLVSGTPPDDLPYVRLANPIASDRVVMRHSLLSSALETVERNAHIRPRMALFEIGPVFLASEEGSLPDEMLRLVVVLTGPRALQGWQLADTSPMDFYDLKGILEGLLEGMHLSGMRYEPAEHPSFHPGKCARIFVGEHPVGLFGELHPQVRERYDLPPTPLLAADIDLRKVLSLVPEGYQVQTVSPFPPVLEDLAVVVDEDLPAERVAEVIRAAGGRMVTDVRLFDVYRSEQIGAGKKSLAYSLTYQTADRTLTDKEVGQIRQKIVRRLEQEIGGKLRG